jgi:hypothetical protein
MPLSAFPTVCDGQAVITLTLAECHWLRIRAALLCAAEDLSQVGSSQEDQYRHSYELVKIGIAPYL